MSNWKSITYTGWLNEEKMSIVLKEVVKEIRGELLPCGYKENAKRYNEGTQIKLTGSTSYYDFGFTYNGTKYLVEFDGNYRGVGHYNYAENCYKDEIKNELAKLNGFKIIRFPYWLQLSNLTFILLFGFDCGCNIVNNFPNGFITNDCLNPASFCKLGSERFEKELSVLNDEIQFEVLVSLKVKSDRLNVPMKYIWDDSRMKELHLNKAYNETYARIKKFADDWNKRNK